MDSSDEVLLFSPNVGQAMVIQVTKELQREAGKAGLDLSVEKNAERAAFSIVTSIDGLLRRTMSENLKARRAVVDNLLLNNARKAAEKLGQLIDDSAPLIAARAVKDSLDCYVAVRSSVAEGPRK